MQTIRYEPVHGSLEPVQCAGAELVPGQDTVVTDEQAELLLRNRFFVDAKSGNNPNFVCTECGKDTFEDAVFDPVLARTSKTSLRSLTDGDKRRCASCSPRVQVASGVTYTYTNNPTTVVSSSLEDVDHDE